MALLLIASDGGLRGRGCGERVLSEPNGGSGAAEIAASGSRPSLEALVPIFGSLGSAERTRNQNKTKVIKLLLVPRMIVLTANGEDMKLEAARLRY